MKVTLVISEPVSPLKQRTRTIEVAGDCILIGRDRAPVRLTDPRCSRQHAILFEARPGELWLRDIGSTNGTFLDGRKLDTCQLEEGDTFRIGKCEIEVIRFMPAHSVPLVIPDSMASRPALDGDSTSTRAGTPVPSVKDALVVSWPDAMTCLPPEKQREFRNFMSSAGAKKR